VLINNPNETSKGGIESEDSVSANLNLLAKLAVQNTFGEESLQKPEPSSPIATDGVSKVPFVKRTSMKGIDRRFELRLGQNPLHGCRSHRLIDPLTGFVSCHHGKERRTRLQVDRVLQAPPPRNEHLRSLTWMSAPRLGQQNFDANASRKTYGQS